MQTNRCPGKAINTRANKNLEQAMETGRWVVLWDLLTGAATIPATMS